MQPCHVNCSVSHLLDKVSVMFDADIPPRVGNIAFFPLCLQLLILWGCDTWWLSPTIV